MPTAKSFLENFSNLDNLTVEEVTKVFKKNKNIQILENDLGNRLLYPQSVPLSDEQLQLDIAILEQALKLQSQKFFDEEKRKILIPESLLENFPDLGKLAISFIEAFNPLGIVSVYLHSERLGPHPVGTFVKPEIIPLDGVTTFVIEGKEYKIKTGQIERIPALSNKVDFLFYSPSVKIMNQEQISTEVVGGSLGVIIDMRVPS